MTVLESPLASKIKHIYKHIIGDYYFFDGLVISETKQDIVFDHGSSIQIIAHIKNYFKDTEFIYASNRVHDYTIDNSDWKSFFSKELHKPMKACAVIDYKKTKEELLNIEKEFEALPIDYKCFSDFEEFIDWLDFGI